MSNVMMLGRALVGSDTFPPKSHGCPWLALIGPSCVGKGRINLHSFVEVVESSGERGRELIMFTDILI